MSEQFEKLVNLYQPSDQNMEQKQDESARKDYPTDLNLLPLAKLCPQLGEVIPAKCSNSEGPQQTC